MTSPTKRYQIFISSTYGDLQEERAEVTHTIMELGHIPYGMEAFPATNETQWEWIKNSIEESDYYIVIIGGKYGSINPQTGLSYTEMEYRYANEVGVPTIAFIIDKDVDIPRSKLELDNDRADKLAKFKDFIEGSKLRKSFKNKDDLKAKVITSLMQLMRQYPRTGWIRADSLKEFTPNSEVIQLIKDNQASKTNKESLLQGNEVMNVEYSIWIHNFSKWDWEGTELQQGHFKLTWDEIFFIFSESLYPNDSRLTKQEIKGILESNIERKIEDTISSLKLEEGDSISIQITNELVELILLQFEALRYIRMYNSDYWGLTQTGRNYYIAHKALKK